jgi:hypothetical protein
MKAMFMTKLKMATAVLLALASIGTVVRMAQVKAAGPGPEENSAPRLAAARVEGNKQAAIVDGLRQQVQEQTWLVAGVDGASNTISLSLGVGPAFANKVFVGNGTIADGKEASPRATKVIIVDDAKAKIPPDGAAAIRVVSGRKSRSGILMQVGVAENAEVLIDGQQINPADVQPGMQVSLQMAQDRPTITRINAINPGKVTILGMDVEKRAITVSVGGQEWTAPVVDNATVVIAGNQEAQLSDLSVGTWVSVRLGVDADRIVVTSILSGGE